MTSTDPLNLDAIEARANAATPGPWRDHDTHLGQYGCTATVLSGEGNDTDLRAWLPSLSQEPWDETRNVWADAAFIAAARTDVPALLAEVRRLRTELAEYEPLNPQQCPAGKHADWLIDSEYAHACPWCQIEQQKADARVQAIRDLADKADPQRPEISFFGDHGHIVGAWMRKQAEYEQQRLAAAGCSAFEKEYQGVSDAKRRLANCKHCGQPRSAHLAAEGAQR